MRGRRQREKPVPQKSEKYLLNEQITEPEVRVIGLDGEQIGIIKTTEAIARAEEEGVDLVAVAPEAKPPVCKLLDYGKLKYKEQKKQAEARKKTATHTVKELRIRYSTEQNDLDTKIRKARNFLEGGDRVRFLMRFKGREVVYKDLGRETLNKVIEILDDVALVEDYSPLQGNKIIVTLAPKTAK